MEISLRHINDYLHFGYVPDLGKGKNILDFNPTSYSFSSEKSENEYIAEGRKVLNEVFDEMVQKFSVNDKHLIPLSGGLDSRLIYAALYKRINPEKLSVKTFGSAKTWDYEIPKKINSIFPAGSFERIDGTMLNYSMDQLVEAAKDGGQWTSVPDIYINRLALKNREGVNIWSGFIGDFIAGSYSTKSFTDNAYKEYAQNEKKSKEIKLTNPDYNPVESIIRPEITTKISLNEYEQITLSNRIPASTFPILFPKKNNLISPLIHPLWVNFMFQVPSKYRRNSSLFKKIIMEEFSDWNFKTKNNLGLLLKDNSRYNRFLAKIKIKTRLEIARSLRSYKFPPLGINYIYYPEAIRQQQSLRKSIEEACISLQERNIIPWISPIQIFQDHMRRKKDYSQALLLLLGLEVNLRATNK